MTLSGATIPGQSEPVSDGNKGILCIPPNTSITGTSLSYCLVSYLGHLLGVGSYTSAEMQSVYSDDYPLGMWVSNVHPGSHSLEFDISFDEKNILISQE